jgi:hypothetical protein
MAAGSAFGTITYTPATNVFQKGVAITSLSPTVTGGTVTTYAISPTLPTGLAMSTSTGIISGTPTVLSSPTNYTVTASGGTGGAGTFVISIAVRVVNTWKGTTNAKWATNTNWSTNAVPGLNDDVQIGVTTYSTSHPIIITAQTVNSITFGPNTGSTLGTPSPLLTIGVSTTAGIKLTVNNALTVNGGAAATLTPVNGGLIAVGSAAFASGSASSLTLSSIALPITNDLTINGGATASIINTGTGTISAGTTTFTSGTSSLTLTGIALPVAGALTVNGGATATIVKSGTGTISAGSAAFTSGTSSLTLTGIALPITNALTVNGGALATISGTGTITAGSAAFASGIAASLTLSSIALPITNDLTINGGATATIVQLGTGTISAGTTTFTSGTSSLTLTSIALPVTGALTVSAGALATITGSGTISTGSANFASGSASSLTLTGVALPVTNTFTVNGGASATLTGTGSISAGSAAFTSGTSSLALNMSLPVTNALTINAGAVATITGTGIIRTGSATFGTGTAASLTLTGIPLSVTNALSIVAGASATLAGTGKVSTNSLTFAGLSAALTVTDTLTITNDFTVNTGATATIAGTGNVNISPLATLNVVTTGVLTTTMTGKLTLKSDATGSASVGQILSTSITGSGADSIHVERFMTGGIVPATHRGYYLMSSPVYAATANSNKVYDLHYLRYGGMYLTGAGGTASGFDQVGNPTIYLFREDRAPNSNSFTSGNYWGISKINNANPYDYNLNSTATTFNIPSGNGFMVFFRGNRGAASVTTETFTTFLSAPTVTLTIAGTLNAGQVVFHNWYRPTQATLAWSNATANGAVRGFNLVGNPYASSIDWDTFQTTTTTTGIYGTANVGNTIYEYDPASHVYSTYQKGTGGNGAHTGNATHIISSGQGFFVSAAVDSTEQLIFNESAKVTTQNTGVNLFMSTRANMAQLTSPAPEAHLLLTLVADSINKEDTYIGFNSAASTNYVFNEDAPYKAGLSIMNLSSFSKDNVQLAINKLPFTTLKSDTVVLKVFAVYSGTYTLNMSEVNSMPAIYDVWLMDAFTKDSLDMRHNPVYTFNVNTSNAASYGKGRFSLIIRENPALALHLLSFTGTKATTGAQINWTTENEANYTDFAVERSTDNGVTFTALGGFNSSSQGTYGFLDTNPLLGVDMYRLKLTDINGTVTYSNVVSLTYAQPAAPAYNPIKVYPNPVKSTLNLFISSVKSNSGHTDKSDGLISSQVKEQTDKIDEYSITIVSNSGAVLKKAVSNQATWQTDVSNFMPGSYVIQVTSKNGKGVTGQCVFIKL